MSDDTVHDLFRLAIHVASVAANRGHVRMALDIDLDSFAEMCDLVQVIPKDSNAEVDLVGREDDEIVADVSWDHETQNGHTYRVRVRLHAPGGSA